MSSHNPEQNTAEWHRQRTGVITASRVGAILGLSKYRTRDDVLRDMVREYHGAPSEFTGNAATEYGQQHEPDAIAAFEAETGLMVDSAGFVPHPQHDWLGASPDGYVGEHALIECKSPYRAKYREASEEYRQQMQLQMACTGRHTCYFVIWRPDETIISEYQFDAGEFANNLDTLRQFHQRYEEIIASDELSAPYLDAQERDDQQWRDAVRDLIEARTRLATAKDDEKRAMQALQELAPNGAKGCGLTLSKVEKQGSISYSKAIKDLLPDADLEPYRGKGSTYFKATITE